MKPFLKTFMELLADAIRIFSAIILSAVIFAVVMYVLLAIFGGTQ